MAEIQYPYVDLSVLPEISPHVLAPHAAIVFSNDLTRVFWANGEGAELIGMPMLDQTGSDSKPSNRAAMRQIDMAVNKLANAEGASAVMRIPHGFQTRLLAFNVRSIELPGGEPAVLLVTDSLHGRRHGLPEMAQSAVDCLEKYSNASAVFDEKGQVLGATASFGRLSISQHDLETLAVELASEDDRLVKRTMETSDGAMAFGAARIGDVPFHHLIILMDAEAGNATAAPANPSAKETSEATKNAASEPAEEEDAPSAVGAFSSKRPRPGTSAPGRWYFKQPTPQDDEPDSEPPVEVDTTVNETPAEKPSAPVAQETASPSDDTDDAISAGGLIKTMDHTPVERSGDRSAPEADAPDTEEREPVANNLPASQSTDGFRDTDEAQPVRFVWEMDSSTVFTHVSDELKQAVGDKAASVVGLSWQEVSWFYGLNEEKEISALLEKGDTWSGKTVLWPIDGTDLRVPIDLSALPTFDRNRDFAGFSGFGIIRMSDAVVDSDVTGVGFEGKQPPPDTLRPGKIEGRKVIRKPEPKLSADNPKIENPEPFEKEEISTGKGLSSDEKSAFDKIGKKLTKAVPKPAPAIAPKEVKGAQAEKNGTPEERENKEPEQPLAKETEPPVTPPKKTNRKVQTPKHDVDTSILARLPIPVLVYRDNDLLFANDHFFELTGFNTLEDLADVGGVEALFGSHINNVVSDDARIFHRDGSSLNVFPNLQRVPWDEERAMLLTLRRQGPDDGDDDNNDGKSPPSGNEDKSDKPEKTEAKVTKRPARNISVVVPSGKPVAKPAKAPPAETNKPTSVKKSPKPKTPPKVETNPVDQPTFGDLDQNDLHGILDTATDGVVILTENGKVEALNRSAEALFDCDSSKAQGKDFTEFLAPESRLVAADYLSEFGKPGVAGLLNDGREVIGQTARGGLIPLFMTTGKMESKASRCVILKDITQWKKAEEELLNAKKNAEAASSQKSDFLAKISHEVRTPLNAIIGFSDIMIEERFGKIDNDRYKDYLRDIHRSGTHVLELINDLLDISKIEAGQMELTFDACDLNALVSETVALSQPQANKERVIIRTSLSAAVPQIVADQRSLRQIILNLVTNGIKFSRSGGQVIVSTAYNEDGEVALRVRDTGVGMSESELERALKPFAQINSPANFRPEGTGLGLPLTKAMVEANRARFDIESEPGKGTLVEITIPTQRVLAER